MRVVLVAVGCHLGTTRTVKLKVPEESVGEGGRQREGGEERKREREKEEEGKKLSP